MKCKILLEYATVSYSKRLVYFDLRASKAIAAVFSAGPLWGPIKWRPLGWSLVSLCVKTALIEHNIHAGTETLKCTVLTNTWRNLRSSVSRRPVYCRFHISMMMSILSISKNFLFQFCVSCFAQNRIQLLCCFASGIVASMSSLKLWYLREL